MPESAASPATDSTTFDHLGARPTPPGPRPSLPETSSACSPAPAFVENGWPQSLGSVAQCPSGRWPNAGPMANGPEWPLADGLSPSWLRQRQRRPGATLRRGQPRPNEPLGSRWPAIPQACFRHPGFCAGNPSPNPNPYPNPTTGFCAENPTKEHICKNKQLLHFKSINQIPPFNKPASKPGAGAAAPNRKLD